MPLARRRWLWHFSVPHVPVPGSFTCSLHSRLGADGDPDSGVGSETSYCRPCHRLSLAGQPGAVYYGLCAPHKRGCDNAHLVGCRET